MDLPSGVQAFGNLFAVSLTTAVSARTAWCGDEQVLRPIAPGGEQDAGAIGRPDRLKVVARIRGEAVSEGACHVVEPHVSIASEDWIANAGRDLIAVGRDLEIGVCTLGAQLAEPGARAVKPDQL